MGKLDSAFIVPAMVLIAINTIVLIGASSQNIQANHVPDLEYHFEDGEICIPIDLAQFAEGASMRPRIFNRNLVLWRDWDGNKQVLKEGQIVLIQDGNNIYAHTIYAMYSDYFITWGDNNPVPDEFVPYSNLKKISLGVLYT